MSDGSHLECMDVFGFTDKAYHAFMGNMATQNDQFSEIEHKVLHTTARGQVFYTTRDGPHAILQTRSGAP